uniref:Fumarylacetoacetase-like C-terminal domain-containing protein n=1 Tax=Hanusia phi TaxID=3032 RepID=A0A6T7MF69_9CRYP
MPDAPADVENMYCTHEEMMTHPLAESEFGGLAGYKLGAAGAEGEVAIYAPIFNKYVTENSSHISKSCVNMHTLEAEIGIFLSSDLTPREGSAPYTLEEVWKAVGTIHPVIECCGRRMTPELTSRLPQLARFNDALMTGGVVLGEKYDANMFTPAQLESVETKICINGEIVAEGRGSACPAGGPIQSLTWFVNRLNGRGRTLRKNQLVITGATCKTLAFKENDEVVAKFSEFPDVSTKIIQ